ncbi:hypothetical protein BpHYR1_040661 [Brachionus plicatilis]|uniref:Uncharacterized protein n=1 Tax=Brachionus plicatilis TaxID=10195 RepID=A0A3M7RN14_BRAPC|nr:hypothetical protein BpHYR1_040661 [Brachionus plicatilis]
MLRVEAKVRLFDTQQLFFPNEVSVCLQIKINKNENQNTKVMIRFTFISDIFNHLTGNNIFIYQSKLISIGRPQSVWNECYYFESMHALVMKEIKLFEIVAFISAKKELFIRIYLLIE